MNDRDRERRVAAALGDAPVFPRHAVGELEPLTLREYLAELAEEDNRDSGAAEELLLRLARIALETP
jgi:hypothetical protein